MPPLVGDDKPFDWSLNESPSEKEGKFMPPH